LTDASYAPVETIPTRPAIEADATIDASFPILAVTSVLPISSILPIECRRTCRARRESGLLVHCLITSARATGSEHAHQQ